MSRGLLNGSVRKKLLKKRARSLRLSSYSAKQLAKKLQIRNITFVIILLAKDWRNTISWHLDTLQRGHQTQKLMILDNSSILPSWSSARSAADLTRRAIVGYWLATAVTANTICLGTGAVLAITDVALLHHPAGAVAITTSRYSFVVDSGDYSAESEQHIATYIFYQPRVVHSGFFIKRRRRSDFELFH